MLPLSGYCRASLRRYTPCIAVNDIDVARALAEVHAELILVHPFRDGNVRLARLLALLMGEPQRERADRDRCERCHAGGNVNPVAGVGGHAGA